MITLLLDSSGIGGIETHVAVLAETLRGAKIPCEIVFLADHGPNPFHRQLQDRGLTFSTLKGGFSSLRSHLKAAGTKLLHTHGYKAGILGRVAARISRVPVVSTYHAGESAPFPVNLYQILDAWTGFLGGRIAVSKPIVQKLPFGATLIPNFIAVGTLPPSQERPPQIGFVGRVSAEKAPDRFCALAERLGGRAHFHLFGDGPMRAELEARYGRSVRFHGFLTDPNRIWPYLDLLVIPSRAEGLPMAALEAISRGIPLVASEIGALPDVIGRGKAGWLIPAEPDEAAIAGGTKAIETWLALPPSTRDFLSQNAHAHAAAQFSASAALPSVLAVYQKAGYPAA